MKRLRTPLTYYGGKQRMLTHILPRIPPHELYTEPFCGGAAVFWGKPPSPVEVLNDRNGEIMNFYRQTKLNHAELAKLVSATICSRRAYEIAAIIYFYPELFEPVHRAWAVWTLANEGFAGQLAKSWGYCNKPTVRGVDSHTRKIASKKEQYLEKDEDGASLMAKRLEYVQIENVDALTILRNRNEDYAFHYVDPPYVDSHQGHYEGYTHKDFDELLQTLALVKGKFLLSCYDNATMREYAGVNGWVVETFDQPLVAAKQKDGKRPRKTECLVRNYEVLTK